MNTDQVTSKEQVPPENNAAGEDATTEYEAWRKARWEEMAGPQGKAKVVAKGMISGPEPQIVPDIPGRWSTTEAGGLTVTAALADGVVVEGKAVDGTVDVRPGSHPEFFWNALFCRRADRPVTVLRHRTGVDLPGTFPEDFVGLLRSVLHQVSGGLFAVRSFGQFDDPVVTSELFGGNDFLNRLEAILEHVG